MSRSTRLFHLLQQLRTLPPPVTATRLAEATGVSLRSVYRDIDSLRLSGAEIAGERGIGYTLVEDGSLPLRAFTRLEIEALTLGMAEVRHMGDPAIAQAAASVLVKVKATLPSLHQQHVLHAVSQVHRFDGPRPVLPDLRLLREGCWHEEALSIRYRDKANIQTERKVWPLAIMYVEKTLVLLTWCTLRQDFRMFRAERIESVGGTSESFRPRRVALLREYLSRLEES